MYIHMSTIFCRILLAQQNKQQMFITLAEGLPTLVSLVASPFSFSLAVLAQEFHFWGKKNTK